MGYRSDVKMTITVNTKKESVEKLLDELKNLKDKNGNCFWDRFLTFEDNVKISSKHNNVINIKIDSVKWYGTYETIIAFEDWKATLEDRGHPYHFVRIGEDITDIKEELEDMDNDIALAEYIHIHRYANFEEEDE